jgi:hypothetical protein
MKICNTIDQERKPETKKQPGSSLEYPSTDAYGDHGAAPRQGRPSVREST